MRSDTRGPGAAGVWWLLDSIGAIAIAAALALYIGHRATPASPAWAGAWTAALLLVAGGAIRAFAVLRAQRAGQAAAIRAKQALRRDFHAALLPSRLQRARLIGEDLDLAIDAVERTEGLTARFLPLRFAATIAPLIIGTAILPASFIAAGIVIATLAPFMLAMILAGSSARRAADQQHLALSRLSGLFVDRIRTLPAIRSFGAEERIAAHLETASHDVARRTLRVLRIAFLSSAALEFFAALSVALVAVYCGFSLLGLLPFPAPERLTLTGAFFALALAPEFYLGMRRMAAAYHDKQTGEAAMAAIAHESARIPPAPSALPLGHTPTLSGHAIVLRHPDGATIGPLDWAWHGPGLHAVTGPTGAGKSSLLLALVGQVPVVGGEARQDGAPLAFGALNPAIGWAGQVVALIPGSLRDNLAVTDAPFDDAEALALLHRLGLGPMLAKRGGLAAPLDFRGAGLSGGERRRIGLARAVLSRRPVLLLDEPTADLDADTAHTARALLRELAANHLVVVATHDAELADAAETLCPIAV